jgi:hypothetical protein
VTQPNIGLQRTSSRRLAAAEAASLGALMSKNLARLAMAAHVPVLGIAAPWICSATGLVSDRAEAVMTALLLTGFTVSALMMLVMLIACMRNRSLSASEKRTWELLIFVGGPITSCSYFWHEAKNGT